MKFVKLAALALVAALLALPAVACAVPPGGEALRIEALARINAERGRAGVQALSPSPALERAAQLHACDSAAHGRMSHTGSDGSRFGDRIRRAGYSYRRASENVALGHADAASLVAGWMGSRGHRRNLLDRGVQEIGLGLARGRNGHLYWVMVAAAR
jgi:uncharacterized protein YkwD